MVNTLRIVILGVALLVFLYLAYTLLAPASSWTYLGCYANVTFQTSCASGTNVQLSIVNTTDPSTLPDAVSLGVITNFTTTNPNFGCRADYPSLPIPSAKNLSVYGAQAEYPGKLVAYAPSFTYMSSGPHGETFQNTCPAVTFVFNTP